MMESDAPASRSNLTRTPRSRRGPVAGLLSLILAGGLLSCDRGPEAGPAAGKAPAGIPVRILNPRGSPRVPFSLFLEAEAHDGLIFELRLRLQSPVGGPGTTEFSFPDGFEVIDGAERNDFELPPGGSREDRIVVRIPPAGYRVAAASAEVGGRRDEAYVEFGERLPAESRGLRVRDGGAGMRVLRIDAEEAAR